MDFQLVTVDNNGYVTLNFSDTSHELFYLMPKNTGSFEVYKQRIERWNEALTFGGRTERLQD